eukprot:215744-Pleurochrysis_carterae.AAC.2
MPSRISSDAHAHKTAASATRPRMLLHAAATPQARAHCTSSISQIRREGPRWIDARWHEAQTGDAWAGADMGSCSGRGKSSAVDAQRGGTTRLRGPSAGPGDDAMDARKPNCFGKFCKVRAYLGVRDHAVPVRIKVSE